MVGGVWQKESIMEAEEHGVLLFMGLLEVTMAIDVFVRSLELLNGQSEDKLVEL